MGSKDCKVINGIRLLIIAWKNETYQGLIQEEFFFALASVESTQEL